MNVLITFLIICTLTYEAHSYHFRIKRSTPGFDDRIIGGYNANIEDLPYQLSLQSDGSHICGASIISANWSLTAAHCVKGVSPSSISLRAGSSYMEQGGTVHQAAQIIVHPYYDSGTVDYDFAVIKVNVPFPLEKPGVQAIPLTDVVPSDGTSCVVSGWGTTVNPSSIFSKQLQRVNVDIVNFAKCQNSYREYSITERMICAGVPLGGKDSCYGDSGGPLVSNEYGVLVGIVSWGFGCALPNFPGVYSNIANQLPWIRQNTGLDLE